jgi:putative MFS transporter
LTLCAYAIVAVGFALYMPELFPTRLRFRGVSVANGIGRLTSSQVGFIIVWIFGAFGIAGVSGFLAGAMLLLAAAVLLLGRETSHRSLEEIEAEAEYVAPVGLQPLAND